MASVLKMPRGEALKSQQSMIRKRRTTAEVLADGVAYVLFDSRRQDVIVPESMQRHIATLVRLEQQTAALEHDGVRVESAGVWIPWPRVYGYAGDLSGMRFFQEHVPSDLRMVFDLMSSMVRKT